MSDEPKCRARLTDSFRMRTEPEFSGLLDLAAQHAMTSRSQYARDAVMDRLRADGFLPAEGTV
jgi:hypothetical protein